MSKKIFLITILIISIFFLSLSCVSAEESNDTDSSSNSNILEEYSDTSFSALFEKINSGDDEVSLDWNYVYDEDTDSNLADGCTIANKVTINGNGHTIDASNKARIFQINGKEVSLNNVVLKNAKAPPGEHDDGMGGAILSTAGSSIILNNCTFISDNAGLGGAIYSDSCSISATGCNFTNNTGAAIYCIGGNFTIEDSRFTANPDSAIYCHNALVNISASQFKSNSGIMECTWSAIVSIAGSTFRDNVGGEYGSIHYNNYASVNISNSAFINNTADSGGVIFCNAGYLNLLNSTFTGNTARYGGAIYCNNNRPNIRFSNFTNNSADWGGAIFVGAGTPNIENVTFKDNSAEKGGAIYTSGSSWTLINSTLINNTAEEGGGIYGSPGVINTTFIQNNASQGGAISGSGNIADSKFINNTASNKGGAVSGSATIAGCTFINNTVEGRYLGGGAVYGSATISDSYFANNKADAGGALYGASSIEDSVFDENTANMGGAFYFSGCNVRIARSVFTNNEAENGGAISDYNSYHCTLTITDSRFTKNRAGLGGALYSFYNHDGHSIISNSNFTENAATDSGGAVCYEYAWGTLLDIENADFANNSASRNGGAIYFMYELGTPSLNIHICNFTQNSAKNGGAIYNTGDFTCIYDSRFMKNTAQSGGAIYVNGENAVMVAGSRFTDNTADTINTKQASALNVDFYPDVAYGDDELTIIVSTDYPADGKVTVTVCGSDHVLNLVDYVAMVNISGLSPGPLKVTSRYWGNDIYRPCTVESTVNVTDDDNLNLLAEELVYFGEDLVIDVYAAGSGNVTVLVNGREYVIELIHHNAHLSIADANVGEYHITATYNGKSNSTKVMVMDTFTNLQKKINMASSGSSISLYHDYIYDYKTAISITKAITINGNGHILNGRNEVGIFNLDHSGIVINNITFIGGHSYDGGAIYADYDAAPTIANCTFINNTADNEGGAIFCDDAAFSVMTHIIGCTFTNNTATYGGAVHCNFDDTVISGCTFTNNTAGTGAAISSFYGKIGVSDSVFIGNYARSVAGAIYIYYGKAAIDNCDFINNTAKTYAGAIYYSHSVINVNNSNFIGNCAKDKGGAIMLDSDGYSINSVIENSNFTCNVAKNSVNYANGGSAIYCPENNITVTNCTFTVKSAPLIKISAGNIEFGDVLIVNVRLPVYATDEVTVTVNGKSEKAPLSDGIAILKVYNLEIGTHNISAYYGGDENYFNASARASVNVTKITTQIAAFSDYISWEDELVLEVRLPEDATGNIMLSIGGADYSGKAHGLDSYIALPDFENGNYSYVLTYSGDDKYYGSNTTGNVTFFKIINENALVTPDIVIPLLGLVPGNKVIQVTLPEDATGTVTLTVNNADHEFDVANGKAIIRLPNLVDGDYEYTITYSGDGKYASYSTEGIMLVDNEMDYPDDTKTVPEIVIPPMNSPPKDGYITVTLPADAKGTVTLTIEGIDYEFNVKNGRANVIVPQLEYGDYEYTITYSGDEQYASFTSEGHMTVDGTNSAANGKITVSNLKVTYSSGQYCTIRVAGADGRAAGDVTVRLSGKISKTLKTDSNGIARFKVTQKPGSYKFTVSALNKKVTATLTVKHLLTLKTATVKKSAKKVVLQASLGKVNGKYLKNKKVTFKFNGKKYSAKTNKKGIAKITIKAGILKKLNAGKKVSYQATYGKDTVKKTVKVKK